MVASAANAPEPSSSPPPVRLDHVWIATQPGAGAEATALKEAGFTVAPTINEHKGQGTASATVEFLNGFLELIWPDPKVPVTGEGGARTQQQFRNRSDWRTSGYSPLGIVLARTSTTPARFPFETWEVSADWMPAGTAMVMLTPRGSQALNISIHPNATDEAANVKKLAAGGDAAAMFTHANGARRITAVRISAPDAAHLPPSAEFVRSAGAADLQVGKEWLLELTLDNGTRKQLKDFRPTIPLIVRW
jgi:hypothetical protein